MHRIDTTQPCRFLALSVWVAAWIFTFVGTARSQGASGWSPQIELAGGYSFIRANTANAGGLNLNGGNESLAYGFTSHFSAVADLGEYRFSGLGAGLSCTMYT